MPPALEFVLPGDPQTRTGGYEYGRRVVAGLRELGWRVRIHTLADGFPFPSPADLAAARHTFAALPDGATVLVDGLAFGALPQLAREQAQRLKLVALVHHPLAAETGLSAAPQASLADDERAALAQARSVVVTSEATAAALQQYGVARGRIAIVEPGTDPRPLTVGAASRQFASTAPLQLLSVATLTPRKGHEVLLQALHTLRHRAWRLDCVGSAARDSETAARLAARIAELDLGQRVSLHGELGTEALALAWQRADVFVHAAHYEGYGMVVAEALAHGLPVVATDVGMTATLIGDDAGLVVPPDDVPRLAAALDRMLQDDALRARCAVGARRAGLALPDWPASCARLAAALVAAA